MTRPVAIVTGGRRGIGLAIATALAEAGFDLAIIDLRELEPEGTESVVSRVKALGADVIYLQWDLADLDAHRAVIERIVEEFGRLDCVVNNAGIAPVLRGDFLDLSPENFDRIIATNLRGTIFFTQAAVRAMLRLASSGQRTIINVTSVSAAMTSPERLDYCISKAGLSAFTQGLALRLAQSEIAVFEVRPGIIRTEMTAGVADKYDALIKGGLVPMRRWGEAGDVGSICASLARGSFAFATGSVIEAGGGLAISRL